MYSGFINLLTYDVVTLYASATLLLCLPPLPSLTISNRAAELRLFLPCSDPGFAALLFSEAAPALPPAPWQLTVASLRCLPPGRQQRWPGQLETVSPHCRGPSLKPWQAAVLKSR